MPRFYAQIEVLVDAECWAEAADALSGLLTETGIYGKAIRNWQYLNPFDGTHNLREVPSSLDFPE